MSLRKLQRSIAKANMQRQGVKHFNKQASVKRYPNGKEEIIKKSVFSQKWKNFVD